MTLLGMTSIITTLIAQAVLYAHPENTSYFKVEATSSFPLGIITQGSLPEKKSLTKMIQGKSSPISVLLWGTIHIW